MKNYHFVLSVLAVSFMSPLAVQAQSTGEGIQPKGEDSQYMSFDSSNPELDLKNAKGKLVRVTRTPPSYFLGESMGYGKNIPAGTLAVVMSVEEGIFYRDGLGNVTHGVSVPGYSKGFEYIVKLRLAHCDSKSVACTIVLRQEESPYAPAKEFKMLVPNAHWSGERNSPEVNLVSAKEAYGVDMQRFRDLFNMKSLELR